MRGIALLALAGIALAAGACSETLESGVGCPELCPNQGIDVINVTIDPVVFDSTVRAEGPFGAEPFMLLASRGDTLDSRVIIRFDSLPERVRTTPGDSTTSPIAAVIDAYLALRLELTEKQIGTSLTVSAYDVDTDGNDTSVAALTPLFTEDRLIGSQQIASADTTDSLRIPLVNAVVLAKAQAKEPLRIGLRITGSTGQFHVRSLEAGTPAVVSFRVSPDTLVPRVTLFPLSRTPEDSIDQQGTLSDFQLVVRTPPPGSPRALLVGGLPSRRTYMRFLIPSSILDSSSVIRATLLLEQIPNTGLGPRDTVYVVTHMSVGGNVVTDPEQAARLIAPSEITRIDTLRVAANASGIREIDIAPVLRIWRAQGDTLGPRALVLRSAREGVSAAQAWFTNTESVVGTRPRLRISYSPANPFGLP
jgi:hypothetical protein